MKIFILLNILLITLSIYLTFNLKNYYLEKKGEKKMTFKEFINNGNVPSIKNIIIGLTFGITFGFIDNIALWFGIESLEKYMPGGVLTKSALGNTYSNVLGVIIGTCISIAAKNIISVEVYQEPLWVNTLGILLGCLLGLFTGILISDRN